MKNYTAAFLSLVNDMARNPSIQIHDFYCTEGCEPKLMEQIENDFSLRLPDVVKHFYSQCNGVSLHWSAEPPGDNQEIVSGRIRLLDLEKVFYGPDRAYWENDIWMSSMSEESKQMRMNLKPFDYFDPDDSGCCCFDLSQQDISENLVLHSVDYGLNSISCNFTQYLDYLFKTRGLVRWQYLFSGMKNLVDYPIHEQFVHKTLARLFNEKL
jgi:hypothetical protein